MLQKIQKIQTVNENKSITVLIHRMERNYTYDFKKLPLSKNLWCFSIRM